MTEAGRECGCLCGLCAVLRALLARQCKSCCSARAGSAVGSAALILQVWFAFCVQFCARCRPWQCQVAALLCSAGVQCGVAVLLGVQLLGLACFVLRFLCSSAGVAVPGLLLCSAWCECVGAGSAVSSANSRSCRLFWIEDGCRSTCCGYCRSPASFVSWWERICDLGGGRAHHRCLHLYIAHQ